MIEKLYDRVLIDDIASDNPSAAVLLLFATLEAKLLEVAARYNLDRRENAIGHYIQRAYREGLVPKGEAQDFIKLNNQVNLIKHANYSVPYEESPALIDKGWRLYERLK